MKKLAEEKKENAEVKAKQAKLEQGFRRKLENASAERKRLERSVDELKNKFS